MASEHEQRHRRMRNYRGMFRIALACLAASVVLTLFGGVKAMAEDEPAWVVYPVLMLVFSVGSAYLTIDSTVRIIDVETEEAKRR